MKFEIKKKLQSLELSELVLAIENNGNNINYIYKSFDERLELLLNNLIEIRYNNLVKRLIKNAEFKYDNASIESIDFSLRDIDKNILIKLSTMHFITLASNLIVTGPTGSGKTYLACSLGIEACKHQYRTYYIKMQTLIKRIDDLYLNQKQLKIFLKRLANYSLLIIDEWLHINHLKRKLNFYMNLLI